MSVLRKRAAAAPTHMGGGGGVFDGLKSVEMLRTLRNLRDDIFTATKREGTRWLFEDYEAEAYAWMEGVTAKICSMNYSPDEFLKDVVEFRELMERPPKKIAGLDWLRLNDLFDAVINKVKDVWMSATISSSSSSSKSSGDRGVPAFAFRDPLDGSVIDIVTDTARALAAADPRPAPSSATYSSSSPSSHAAHGITNPLYAPMNSTSATVLSLEPRVVNGIRHTAANALRRVFDRGAAAGAALLHHARSRASNGGGVGIGGYDAGRKRSRAAAGAGWDDEWSGPPVTYAAAAAAVAAAPAPPVPKRAAKVDRRAAAAAAASAAWLRIDEAATKTGYGTVHGGRGSSSSSSSSSSRRAPAPLPPRGRPVPVPPGSSAAPDLYQLAATGAGGDGPAAAPESVGWVEARGSHAIARVGVTPVVWVEPPKGASKKDVGARPEAQRRGDVHYRVTIRVANKTFVLGTFIAEDDAAKAHDRALIRACGPEAMHVYWADQLGLMAAKLDVAEAVAAAGEAAGMPAVGPALSPLPPLASWLALNYPVWFYAGDPLDWYALLPLYVLHFISTTTRHRSPPPPPSVTLGSRSSTRRCDQSCCWRRRGRARARATSASS